MKTAPPPAPGSPSRSPPAKRQSQTPRFKQANNRERSQNAGGLTRKKPPNNRTESANTDEAYVASEDEEKSDDNAIDGEQAPPEAIVVQSDSSSGSDGDENGSEVSTTPTRARSKKLQQEYDDTYATERQLIASWRAVLTTGEEKSEQLEENGLDNKALQQLSRRLQQGINNFLEERSLERRDRFRRLFGQGGALDGKEDLDDESD